MNCYNKWKTSTLYTGKNEHLYALHSQLLMILLISPGIMSESIVDRICGIDMPPETTISENFKQIQAYDEAREE